MIEERVNIYIVDYWKMVASW